MAKPNKALTDKRGRRYFYPLPTSEETDQKGKQMLASVTTILNFKSKQRLYGWYAEQAAIYAVENYENWVPGIAERATQILSDPDSTISTAEDATNAAATETAMYIAGAPNRNRNRKGNIGTVIHRYPQRVYAEGWERGDALMELAATRVMQGMTPQEIRLWTDPIDRFMEKYVDSVVLAERTVYNPELGYAGTPDLIFKTKKGDTIISDWKTGKYLDQMVACQLYAYACAPFVEPTPTHTDDNGEPEYWDNNPQGDPAPEVDYGLVLQLNGNRGVDIYKVPFGDNIKGLWESMCRAYQHNLILSRKDTKWFERKDLLQLEVAA